MTNARPWPPTRVGDDRDTLHGTAIADPYRWLEAETADEVQAWMTAQDGYTRRELDATPARAELAALLGKLFYFDALGAPVVRGGRYFYSRKHADKEKSVVYWKDGEAGAERVLLDPNGWSADGSTSLGVWVPSWDGRHVAYQVKANNSDEAVLHVLEVATGAELPDTIEGAKYAMPSWAPGEHGDRGFYYTWLPPVGGAVTIADRPGFAEVRFHALGAPVAADPVIHPATGNPQTFLGAGVSRDGHWLIAAIQHGWNATDLYLRDARAPGAAWTPLVVGVEANFSAQAWGDQLYISTDDGAPRGRLFKADPRHPERARWREIVPQSAATLESVQLVGGHLVLSYLRDVAGEIQIHELDGAHVRTLAVPPLGTVTEVTGDPDRDTAYVGYTSFLEPSVIYQASIRTGAAHEWSRVRLPIDTRELVATQEFYPSKDGTRIPLFVLSKKGTPRDGARPTILYGYGGFSVSLTPGFAISRAVWLDRGGVYAIANLRGGGEYGEDWHKAGMGANKQTVFDDFLAAAEHLIAAGWTSPAHLGISGGSNGGLLVGAALSQRPDLFRAVVCAVPLLDMLRYHQFGSGKTWIPEYGSAEDPAQFAVLHAYSPYRVVVDAGPRAYPAVLFDSADHDDRVDPLHARKLAAALQAAQTADRPILLRIERNAGHGGADLVKAQVERAADTLAFFDRWLR